MTAQHTGQQAEACPLCTGHSFDLFHSDRRDYLRCGDCLLVFVPAAQRLAPEAEKAEYDKHENDPADAGYRRFLSRLAEPLLELLAPHSHGLDFGCGPGPTLSLMLEEAGHRVDLYDRFYADDPAVFDRQYDFITATEVVEHLFEPGRELERLWAMLKPGGVLGLMTKLVIDAEAFASWHYRNDPTHVCFFSRDTFAWLADRWGAELQIIGKDVILLTRPID